MSFIKSFDRAETTTKLFAFEDGKRNFIRF